MDLDFETVRALSSPTRIRILDSVLDSEATPTKLAGELDRSKSTISSHLDTLVDAGLVEKDAEEGRRRVVYQPTGKAEDIVQGKERKVRFTLTSSIVSTFAGVALLGYSQLGLKGAGYAARESGGGMGTMSLAQDTATGAGKTAASGAFDPATAALAASIFFFGIAVSGLVYGLVLQRLGS